MRKSLLSSAMLSSFALLAFMGCNDKKVTKEAPAATVAEEGKVLNICVWNEEFQDRFKTYFEAKGLVPAGVKVNWMITPSQDNAYQNKIDDFLDNQAKAAADEKIDLFLVEADYAQKYVNSGDLLDVKGEIGLTDNDLKNQYKYTKDVMTDNSGVLRGVSWQACPGGFIYRRSIAKDVLGTDVPAEVQKYLANWDAFDAVASKAKDKGYFMLSGYDDAFRVFSDNMKTPWVDANKKIQIDPQIKRWIEQTKTYTDKGYNNKANLWSSESFKGAAKDGKVFGYFGPAWFIDFCLAPATLDDPKAEAKLGNGSYGDWAFCQGPQGFCWGGTWICAAKGSDNVKLIRDIMYTLTCDKATLIAIAKEKGDFTNNEEAMAEVANSDYQNPFLGGQNHIREFLDNAKSINKDNISAYDQGMAEKIQGSFADYFNGHVDEATAWDNFYKAVLETYPALKK